MKRFLAASSVLLAVALGSTGCNISATPSVAARVNASTITTAKLNGLMTALKGDSELLCLSSEGTHPITTGAGTGTWSEAYAGFLLTQLIKFDVLRQIVVAHRLFLPVADFGAAKAQLETSLAADTQSGCTGTASKALDDAGSAYQTALVDNQLDNDADSAYLAGTSLQPAVLASWERANQTSTSESCTSVIELTSHALALTLEAAIREGASFASEADSNNPSGSTGEGGAVGCIVEQNFPGNLGPTVAALSVGVVSRPVSYQSDWLLFLVTRRVPEPVDGLLNLLEEREDAAFNQQYGEALSDAHVTVSSVYGTWKRTISSAGVEVAIVPPPDTACAYALSAVAAGCATRSATNAGSSGSG